MIKLITGIFGLSLIVVFLGYYAISINSLPLWIIIVVILAMITTDVIQSIRKKDKNDAD